MRLRLLNAGNKRKSSQAHQKEEKKMADSGAAQPPCRLQLPLPIRLSLLRVTKQHRIPLTGILVGQSLNFHGRL